MINANHISAVKEKLAVDLVEASIITNYSISTLRRLVKSGRLKSTQACPNGKIAILMDDLKQYFGSCDD